MDFRGRQTLAPESFRSLFSWPRFTRPSGQGYIDPGVPVTVKTVMPPLGKPPAAPSV